MRTKLLSLLVLVAMLTACLLPLASAEAESTYTLSPKTAEAVEAGLVNLDGSLPIITDPEAFEAKYGKISMLIVNNATRVVPVEDLIMVQRWAEDTGINFDWQPIPQDGAQEKISLMLAGGGELPDAFFNFGDGRSSTTVVTYLDQDVFLPTEDLIYEYCPTLVKILEENENYMMEVTAPDGHMYGFPYIEEMYGLVLTPGPLLINEVWLEKVGMDMPTNTDELKEVLIAFRDAEDLNGNGEADEIPMATIFGAEDTFGSYDLFYRFTGAFGCEDTYCGGNKYADHLRLIDGKVTYTALDESFGKTAMYFHELYQEGLLNKDAFDVWSETGTNYTNNELVQDVAKIGVVGVWSDMTITNNDVRHEYVAIPQMTGPDGTVGNALNYSELQDSSDMAITVDCEFPEIIAAFNEYMISDPKLSIQSNWGAVGYNYYEDEDGVLRFNLDDRGDIVPVDPYKSFGEMRINTTTARGSMIVLNEYYDNVVEYTYDAANLLAFQRINGKDNDLEQYDTVPKIMLTNDEQATISRLYDPLADTVDRYVVEWVLGGNVEETWDAYVAEIQAAGVDQLVEIYQTAIDRTLDK
ncbi:extracellular solute-binding protein [Eubacteriales bacterium OttesenSCG-928-A19]|nr:extracellular solute-binding protein [Eubacteriales bacterium OttesenSCG-928-A19]